MMETELAITKKLNLLVEMASSTLNIDAAKAELREIERQSTYLKSEMSALKEGKEEEKYFKASEKQVDENIKVSLETKIKKQEKAIKKLQSEIDETVKNENSSHTELTELKSAIKSCYDYILVLNTRITTISEPSIENYYQNLLSDEEKKLSDLNSALTNEENKYSEILSNLNLLNVAMDEMREKLEKLKGRLAETKSTLASPTSYIDEDLKQAETERIKEIKKSLSELDKRKLEIITDPAMIADEAKNLISMDDLTSALYKIKELVSIVQAKPYMELPSSSDLATILKDEEEKASETRDDFATLIDNKDYTGGDTKVIEERINYINIEIAAVEDKIRLAREAIKNIDTVEIQILNKRLNDTQKICDQLEKDIANYKEVINNENEEKTPKRRAVLITAYEKKEQELSNVRQIIANYKKDEQILINKAYCLETIDIAKYEQEIAEHQQEISEMNILLANISKAKDVLAIENDKQKLKDLDEVVRSIRHRAKYNESPSEIFVEIDRYLGSLKNKDNLIHNTAINDPVFEFDYDLEPVEIPEPEEIEDYTESEPIKEPEIDLAPKEINPPKEPTSPRLKVISVEPLEETNPENNSYIIGTYDDEENDLSGSEV